MRLDRLITLSLAQPARSVLRRRAGIIPMLPVLMYHGISDRNESHLRDYFKVCTAPDRFRQQMQTLRNHGYEGVDLESGLAELAAESPRVKRMVGITFDDGFRDFYTEAMPVLTEQGFTATMYLPTAYIGKARRQFLGNECMTWDEVREARRAGMRFGSHTVHHPQLYDLPWHKIEEELRGSRLTIEDCLGEAIRTFAYPYAFPGVDPAFCQLFRETLNRCGYHSCVTTLVGRVASPGDVQILRRLPMNGADDAALLLAKISGAYDWMGLAQRPAKLLKRWLGRGKTAAVRRER